MTIVRNAKRKRSIITILIIGIIVIGAALYAQSDHLKNDADMLLKNGHPKEAIALYQRAQRIFPLRWDLVRDIAGAQLVAESQSDYESITEFAELQETPPLSGLPAVRLNPDELFVPVLMYHHIRKNPMPNNPTWAALNVAPDQLDQQLSYLADHNYHTVFPDTLSDALDGKVSLPANPIILSFDDGYRNFYDNAFPLLQKYHMKAILFVITQVVGTDAYVTWPQITTMDATGLVEFGAHTRHHPNLPDLNQSAIIDEIQGSKSDLEQHLHKPIYWFAYPYGSYSTFIMQTVKNAGFKGAASTVYGTVQSKNTIYLFPRIMVDGRFSIDNIAHRIQQ